MSHAPKHFPENCHLTSCALVAASLLVGGGGTDGADAATASPVVAPSATTAYAKTIDTILYEGKNYGPGRAGAEALVEQCNGFRKFYDLPPALPSESLLASFDVIVQEKYFNADKALTLRTGHIASLPETKRWVDDYKVSAPRGQIPSTPPDCAQVISNESRGGTLWRDGMVYRLLFSEKKAFSRRATQVPLLDQAATLFANAPKVHVVGQTCRDIVNPTGLTPGSDSCVWDLFPYVSNLNWPFVLSGRIQHGPVPGLFETIVPLEARAGQPIDSSIFEIPTGLTVIAD